MSISQIFVLSPRGDVLVFKDFKSNISKSSPEIFNRKAKAWINQGKTPLPIFQVDGIQYLHVRLSNMFWVATTRENVSPSLVTELLMRIYWIITDYVGHISEDAVRQNFLLVYELLDEIMDYGYPQNSSTERLKQFIAMEPMVVRPRLGAAPNVSRPNEVIKSVLDTARTGAKEEIFVDIVEKLTAIFDAGGHLKSSGITGAIQIKSYLIGNPVIRLGLSDNLILNNSNTSITDQQQQLQYSSTYESSDAVVLDTHSLHEAVNQDRFDKEHILELVPPEGHFALLTYRSSKSFRPPFRVYPLMEDDMYTADKLTLYIRIRAEYEPTKMASGVEVTVPLPDCVQRVLCDAGGSSGGGTSGSINSSTSGLTSGLFPTVGGVISSKAFQSTAEWNARERKLVWTSRNLQGGREHTLQARLTVEPGMVEATKRDYGPVMVQFVLPGKPSASGLDVKYMKILKDEKGYNPARWFRVVALARSYQIRTA